MERFSNGAILKWSDSQMERFSNGAILKWSNYQMERFGVATLCHISRSQEQRNMACDVLGVSGNSCSRTFPRMEASDSLSQTLGMDFFIPFPFPNFGDGFFSFPSRSRILGMDFFHSLPVPELWEWIFSIPFPFPN